MLVEYLVILLETVKSVGMKGITPVKFFKSDIITLDKVVTLSHPDSKSL
jgi:hypothetical protein